MKHEWSVSMSDKKVRVIASPDDLIAVLSHVKTTYDRMTPHPWQAFLDARVRVLQWMRADGHSDAEIARTLSMDAGQVASILTMCGDHDA